MYSDWVNNEYKKFENELKTASLENFKELPQVRRMLSLDGAYKDFCELTKNLDVPWNEIKEADSIGGKSGLVYRYVYYADKILKKEFNSIVEIGGGYGGFAVTLQIMAKRKINYSMHELPEVKKFQQKYFERVGVKVSHPTKFKEYDYLVSMYSLGELAKPEKTKYITELLPKVKHGLIIWNDHFEEDIESIELIKKLKPNCIIKQEFPLTAPLNKEIIF